VAIAEYQRLFTLYPSLGFEVMILPKVSVSERADFLLRNLAESREGLIPLPMNVDTECPTRRRTLSRRRRRRRMDPMKRPS